MRRALIAQLLLVAALVVATPAAAVQLGVGAEPTQSSGPDLANPSTAAAIAALHPARVRHDIQWSALEPASGQYDASVIAGLRSVFANLAAQGIAVDVVIFDTPAWAQNGAANPNGAPANPQDYANFMGYIAGQFKGVVSSYATWAGPDSSGAFSGSLATYMQMQKLAYGAIKAADPNATVLLGMLYGYDYPYVQQYLAAGGGGSFDGISVNADLACGGSPYSPHKSADGMISRYSFLGFTSLHAVAPTSPIWISEFGWSTTASCNPPISEAQQASYLQQAVHCLSTVPYVPVAEWYELQDLGTADTPDNRFGLLRPDFSQKPAFSALQADIANGDQLTGACGTSAAEPGASGPTLTISRPRSGASNRGALRFSATASDPAGVRRIALSYDGTHHIRYFDAKPAVPKLIAAFTWQGAKRLKPGTHTLTVTAINAQGGSTTQTVPFRERH
jgi:hypothetical protein